MEVNSTEIIFAIIGLLVGGLTFFLKKSLTTIDEIKILVVEQVSETRILSNKVEILSDDMNELKQDVKDVKNANEKLKIKVAILEREK